MLHKKLLILFSIIVLTFLVAYKSNNVIMVTLDGEGRPQTLHYDTGNGGINIAILMDEEKESYLFLPSGVDYQRVVKAIYEKTGMECFQRPQDNSAKGEGLIAMQGQGIPSVFIDSEDSYEEFSADKDIKRKAQIQVFDENLGLDKRESVEIKGHGQASWERPKKSFNITFEEATSVLGLNPGREYIAVTDTEESHLRNRLTEEMGKILEMEYVPCSEYANLYYNGEYLGIYLFYERITAGEERVNIETSAELSKGEKRTLEYVDNEDIKGYVYPEHLTEIKDKGIILKEEPMQRFPQVRTGFVNDDKYQFQLVYPKYGSTDYMTEIRNYLYKVYEAMENPEGTVSIDGRTKHYSEMIDVYSFAARYLVEQVSKNKDGTRCSSYYYIKSFNGMDSILFAGPIWDYDTAYGYHKINRMYTYPYGIIPLKPMVYDRPDFMAYVVEIYKEKLRGYTHEGIFNDIDRLSAIIRSSVEMDCARWGLNFENFDAAVEELRSFIEVRNWDLDKSWLDNEPPFRINFVKGSTIVHSVYSYDGESIESALTWQPFPEEVIDIEWVEEDEETPADLSVVPDDNMAFWAKK